MRVRVGSALALTAVALLIAAQLVRVLVGLYEFSENRAEGVKALTRYSSEAVARAPGVRVRVVFYGDSRAAAWHPPESVDGTEFLNRGIGGETSDQTRARFGLHVAPLEPDIVVVQTCVNQLKMSSMLPWRRSEFVDGCLDDLESIVARADEIGARVVLTTIFPIGSARFPYSFFYPSGIRDVVFAANERVRALEAANLVVLDATPLLAAADGSLRREYGADWLHLSEAGYAALNERLVPLLAAR